MTSLPIPRSTGDIAAAVAFEHGADCGPVRSCPTPPAIAAAATAPRTAF